MSAKDTAAGDAFERYRSSRAEPSGGLLPNLIVLLVGLAAVGIWFLAAPRLMTPTTSGGASMGAADAAIPQGVLTVVQLDVGQGDAAFIQTPSGKVILIDVSEGTNPENAHSRQYPAATAVVRPFLIKHGITHIDMVILTHPDSDHGGGLAELLDWFYQNGGTVGGFLDAGLVKGARFYQEILRAVDEHDIDYYVVLDREGHPKKYDAGTFHPGFEGGTLIGRDPIGDPQIAFQILGPLERIGTLDGSEANSNSIITRIQMGKYSWLLAGDAEDEQQVQTTEFWGPKLQSYVHFAPHHGSATSKNPWWLQRVNPTIMSSSSHPPIFGHPRQDVMDAWKTYIEPDPLFLRTDKNGDIWFITDGEKLGIRTQFGYKGEEVQWAYSKMRDWEGQRDLEPNETLTWSELVPLEGYDNFGDAQ